MRNTTIALLLVLSATAAVANPTGSPLVSFPVEPCRVFDSRVAIGPLQPGFGFTVFVRGDNIPADRGGQISCGVPPSAQAVLVNVAVVNAGAAGSLRLNGTGNVHGPMGLYSRINFAPGWTVANEMQVSLCNVTLHPAAHQPCPNASGPDRYSDMQGIPDSAAPIHLIVDVVGYLARMPGS